MAKKEASKKPEGESEAAEAAPQTSEASETVATEIPKDVTVPIEGATTTAATDDGKEKKPAKEGIPEHLKKGNRVCAACGTTEADFLAKNPRYSLCQGVDVLCYRKGHRVIYGSTLEAVNAKYPDKVGKSDDKGAPLIQEVGGLGIKPGILVRGAISYSRKANDTGGAGGKATSPTPADTAGTATPISTAAEGAPGSAGTTSVS